MIKEALKYLLDLSIKPDERVVTVEDQMGNDHILVIDAEGNSKEIKPLTSNAKEPLLINTLTGLVEYIKANIERVDSKFYLQVYDEKTFI